MPIVAIAQVDNMDGTVGEGQFCGTAWCNVVTDSW